MVKKTHKQFDFFYKFTEGNVALDYSKVTTDEGIMKNGCYFAHDNITGIDCFFEITSHVLRESVLSESSKCTNRLRQLIVSVASLNNAELVTDLEKLLGNYYKNKRILLLEDKSAFAAVFKLFCKRLNIDLTTSEFFGEDKPSGVFVDNILHVNIEKTHFPDNHFDLILHTDVFEHVPDALSGEREVVRILKPGGAVIFTAPFEFDLSQDKVYAEIKNQEIIYYLEPIYHDDPVSPDGKCLVFRTFTFPDMKQRYNNLKCEFYSEHFHSHYLGILGNNAFTFVAKKL